MWDRESGEGWGSGFGSRVSTGSKATLLIAGLDATRNPFGWASLGALDGRKRDERGLRQRCSRWCGCRRALLMGLFEARRACGTRNSCG